MCIVFLFFILDFDLTQVPSGNSEMWSDNISDVLAVWETN